MANKPKRIIILQGGENIEAKTNKNLFKQVLVLSKTKNILVIPWITDNPEKEKKYGKIIENYFKETGFKKTIFLEKNDTHKKPLKIQSSRHNLPPRRKSPNTLQQNQKRPHVETRLKEFIRNNHRKLCWSHSPIKRNIYQQ